MPQHIIKMRPLDKLKEIYKGSSTEVPKKLVKKDKKRIKSNLFKKVLKEKFKTFLSCKSGSQHESSQKNWSADLSESNEVASASEECLNTQDENSLRRISSTSSLSDLRKPVAIDCEMVGLGERGRISSLGRVSIVDYDGRVIYDIFSRPNEPITDYRTPWSGIRPENMRKAIPFECVQDQVRRIIKDRIVIGHSIVNDFRALELHHPQQLVRDTSKSLYLKMAADLPPSKAPIALRKLSQMLLGRTIQTGEHCSAEDARATMDLYRIVEKDWEKDLSIAAFLKGIDNRPIDSSFVQHLSLTCSDPLQSRSCSSLPSLVAPPKPVSMVTDSSRPRHVTGRRIRMSSYERACSAGYVSTAQPVLENSLLDDEFWPDDE